MGRDLPGFAVSWAVVDKIAVPRAAQPQLRQLYAAYTLRKQELACFVSGLLLGLGLDPDDDWNLDTFTMSLTRGCTVEPVLDTTGIPPVRPVSGDGGSTPPTSTILNGYQKVRP